MQQLSQQTKLNDQGQFRENICLLSDMTDQLSV